MKKRIYRPEYSLMRCIRFFAVCFVQNRQIQIERDHQKVQNVQINDEIIIVKRFMENAANISGDNDQ